MCGELLQQPVVACREAKDDEAWHAEQRGADGGKPTILAPGYAIAALNKDNYPRDLL